MRLARLNVFLHSLEYHIRKGSYIFFSACFEKVNGLAEEKNLKISTHFLLYFFFAIIEQLVLFVLCNLYLFHCLLQPCLT